MQFISYDSDGSEGSKPLPEVSKKECSAESVAVSSSLAAQLPPSWTVQASSDDDSDKEAYIQDHASTQNVHKDSKSTLLDAETLFATTNSKPKFLSRNIDDKFEVSAVKAHTYDSADSSGASKFGKANGNKNVRETTRAVPMASLTTRPPTAKTGEAISESDMALKKKLDDKESAKDRVKRQRLSGQSGVGSDFREWRSEEEMRQRQMYD